MKKSITLVAALSTLLCTARPAAAEPTPAGVSSENRVLAETLFYAAKGLMDEGRFPDACEKLGESYRLDPAAGTLLNLAVCHEKINHIASAWSEYRTAQADAVRLGRDDREALAKEHIALIEPELPWLSIEVPPAVRVEGLQVLRNGQPFNASAWSTEVPVDPGDVEVTAQAPGYLPEKVVIKIAKREHKKLELKALTLAPPPPATGWSATRTTGAVIFGAGLVSVGVGAVFGARSFSKKSDSDAHCELFDGERRCDAEGVANMSDARSAAWISDIGIGVGIAGLAAGTYLFIKGARHSSEAMPQSAKAPPRANSPTVSLSFRSVRSGGQALLVGSF